MAGTYPLKGYELPGMQDVFDNFGTPELEEAWLKRWGHLEDEEEPKLPPPPTDMQIRERYTIGAQCKLVFPGNHACLHTYYEGHAAARFTAGYILGEVVDYDEEGRMIWKALELDDRYGVYPYALHRVDLSDESQRRGVGLAHHTVMRHRVDGLYQEKDPNSVADDFSSAEYLETISENNGGALELLEMLLKRMGRQQFTFLLHAEILGQGAEVQQRLA